MKTIILFYSHSGNTRFIANKKAVEAGADIEEIKEIKKPSILTGTLRAIRNAKTGIVPIKSPLADYDNIIIMSPVWAARPVSAINSVFDYLPAGKKVEIYMVSGGGGTKKSAANTRALITGKGCEVTVYIDLKAKKENDTVTYDTLLK